MMCRELAKVYGKITPYWFFTYTSNSYWGLYENDLEKTIEYEWTDK